MLKSHKINIIFDIIICSENEIKMKKQKGAEYSDKKLVHLVSVFFKGG